MTKPILLVCCCLSVACSETVTTIAVRSSAASGDASIAVESARVKKICATVAANLGLKEKTPPLVSGVTEYAKPMPLSPNGFGGPSIVLSVISPSDLAVFTVSGTGSPQPTSIRLQIANDLKARLVEQFGPGRVRVYDQTGTPW